MSVEVGVVTEDPASFQVGGRVTLRAEAPEERGQVEETAQESLLSDIAAQQGDEEAPRIRGETFQGHWNQMRGITAGQDVPSPDDMVAVLNLLAQMTSLLQMELESEKAISQSNSAFSAAEELILRHSSNGNPLDSIREPRMPCMDLLLSDNILSHVLATSRMPIEDHHAHRLRQQQLILYELLLSSPMSQSLLSHQPFLKPLLELISHFHSMKNRISDHNQSHSKDTNLHMVLVLNHLCQRLLENMDLLKFFFHASSEQFVIFNILVNFIHEDDHTGQLARDALLHCMSLSGKNKEVGHFVAKHSNFCTVLATGLSGMYSLLPRTLPLEIDQDRDWYRISSEEQTKMKELTAFLNSLQFCDSVLHLAPDSVKEQLLGLIYMGFLVPVLGPALGAQNAEAEVICTTAYMDLFLRKLSEISLLAVFLKFIFVEKIEDTLIIDLLTIRITSNTKLCQVTLSLFETFVSLNCEDVMLWLVFRHLIPLRHLLPSQHDAIRTPDLHGRAAERLLSLTPICCQEASLASLPNEQKVVSTSGSMSFSQIFTTLGHRRNSLESSSVEDSPQKLSDNFHLYLKDARKSVRSKFEACHTWQYDYDGLNPPKHSLDELDQSKRSSEDSELRESDGETEEYLNTDISYGPLHPTVQDVPSNSSGYTSLAVLSVSPSITSGPISMTADEDREFWNLMKEPTVSEMRLNKAIRRMQNHDELSLSSGGNLSQSGISNPENYFPSSCEISPRDYQMKRNSVARRPSRPRQEDVDFTVTSLGCFLDSLLEKVELMSSNSLTSNLLVTSILSQLASFPQPLLRSVLILPDILFQPSVRGLFTAIASLRQKLDNIMPTLAGSEEAIILARKFLNERSGKGMKTKIVNKKESNISSTLSHIGHEASRHKSSLTSAFTSMFRKKNSIPHSNNHLNTSAPSSISGADGTSFSSAVLTKEVKMQAMAAVILEEWLQELAAISQEQSVLEKEMAFEVGMGLTSNVKFNIKGHNNIN